MFGRFEIGTECHLPGGLQWKLYIRAVLVAAMIAAAGWRV